MPTVDPETVDERTLSLHLGYRIGAVPFIASANPTAAVANVSGTFVTIKGESFGPPGDIRCKFSSYDSVTAVYVSPSLLRCPVPSHEPALVALSLVNTVGFSSNLVQFQFVAPVMIEAVVPWVITSDGGSNLTVHGVGISMNSAIECQFSTPFPESTAKNSSSTDGALTTGTYISTTTALCESPRSWSKHPCSGLSSVGLIVNGYLAPDVALVLVVPRPIIRRLNPASSPIDGLSKRILVHGEHFRNDTWGLGCFVDGVPEPVTFVSTTSVECTLPSPAGNTTKDLLVQVSVNNGTDLSREATLFRYLPQPRSRSGSRPSSHNQGGTREAAARNSDLP